MFLTASWPVEDSVNMPAEDRNDHGRNDHDSSHRSSAVQVVALRFALHCSAPTFRWQKPYLHARRGCVVGATRSLGWGDT